MRRVRLHKPPVLVGEPYLNHILDKQAHEALRQRIMVHYNGV